MNSLLVKSVFAASAAILILASVLFYLQLAPIRNVIVVGFDGFRDLNILGTSADISAILVSGGLLLLMNMGLAAVWAPRERFYAAVLPFVSLFISILILISVGVTIASN